MNDKITQEEFLQRIAVNKGIIIKICNAYCADKHYREDLAQEIIYQLWRSAGKFRDEYKFSTWMYRIALNVAISFYRKEKNKQALVSYTDLPEDLEDKPDNATEMEIAILRLETLIQELNALDKALMILYLESKSYAEIADILGITETNVATKISRIKTRLKQQFANNN